MQKSIGKKYENILADVLKDRKEGETEDFIANLSALNQIENPYLYDTLQGLREGKGNLVRPCTGWLGG